MLSKLQIAVASPKENGFSCPEESITRSMLLETIIANQVLYSQQIWYTLSPTTNTRQKY